MSAEFIGNRTGSWYMGVVAFTAGKDLNSTIKDGESCNATTGMTSSDLQYDFNGAEYYITRIYTSACYYFNRTSEIWMARGVSVINSTKLTTACVTNHLSQYGSGFYHEMNTIDFQFVFAAPSFKDNMTIFMCLIITFLVFFICLIYACYKDRKDVKALALPFLYDNNPEDTYMYELIVETGPMAAHSTTSRIYFDLTGEEDHTGMRCFNGHPDRPDQIPDHFKFFTSSGVDAFLLTTPV